MKNYFNIENHWLTPATHIESPNANERPAGESISLLVLHNISLPPGEFGGNHIIDFFTNHLDISAHKSFSSLVGMRVSSHLLVRRDGEVVQFVPFHRRAWHAGESSFDGRENCNDFSIGIEIEGTDSIAYEAVQYQQLVKVTQTLVQYYPSINKDRIVGHSDIAPERKTDPGESFNWEYFFQALECDW